MEGNLRAAFLSAEAVPFVKAGGLADVAGALPGELARLGHELRLILPYHDAVARQRLPLTELGRWPLAAGTGLAAADYRLLALAPAENPAVLFIDAPAYFARPGIYTDAQTGEAYADDGERWLFFSLASLDALARLGAPVDLLHGNDHHCGLAPALLERHYRRHAALARTATLHSIHNLAYQGIHPRELLAKTGLDATAGGPWDFHGRLNFMQAGIRTADLLSTVSPRYAQEICSGPEYGYGLTADLAVRRHELAGILNGIDTALWSPREDAFIAVRYGSEDAAAGKAANKKALLAECGLSGGPATPLFGIISRLVDQKGCDLVAGIMARLMSLPLQLVILGTGQKEWEDIFCNWAGRHPERVALFLTFDEGLAHRIEAGADFFLMPSRYEPCGLNQMYSLRYGTLPVVRATGGLADTVVDAGRDAENGNGIVFEPYEAESLLDAIRRALVLYEDKNRFARVRRRAMGADFSWARSARAYSALYQAAACKRRGQADEARRLLAQLAQGTGVLGA